jgi:secondary thiamine-phosphate synthase enzyme
VRQASRQLLVETKGQRLHEITRKVQSWVAAQGIGQGLLTLFVHHTSASLLIQENADPRVQDDLNGFFRRLVSEDRSLYSHNEEGPDDMPAHIRAALTTTQLSIPVTAGRADLGRWQGVFLYEHRTRGRERRITLHLLGE